MNIRKVLAGGLAAITAGATIALGAAAITSIGDYVGDVTAGALASPTIVIGDTVPTAGLSQVETIARTKDVLGAADIAAAVAGYATTTVATGAGATVVVSGGADAATVDNKLYMSSKLNKAKDTITATELPTLLAKGTVTVSGVAYEYDQYITLGSNPTVTYGIISAANILDPVAYLSMSSGSTTANVIYNASIVFNKPLNISDSHTQGKRVTFFGSDYTIAPNSGGTDSYYNPLILQGYGITETLILATPATISIGGTSYTVEATFIGDDQLLLKVEGVTSDTLTAGDSDVISGLDIYVKSILYSAVAGINSMAIVSLGSEKLTLTNGESVTLGTATTLDGTVVEIVGDASGVSKITVSVAAEDSTVAYIQAGTPFVDPVFGSFKVAFNGLTTDLTDAARDTVTLSASNTQVSVAFTDYKGNAKTMNFARMISTTGTRNLNATSTQKIVIMEGETINRNDVFVFAPNQESEFGHILKLSSITGVDGTNAKFKIEDVVTGSSTTYTLGSDSTKNIYIDGQRITVKNVSNSAINATWGDADTVVFPLIKLQNGEYMTFVDNKTTFANETIYELPGNDTVNISYVSMTDTSPYEVTAGKISYWFTNTTSGAIIDLVNITDSAGTILTATFPAILIMQEKDNSTTKDFITLRTYERDTTNHYIGVAQPTFTDAVGSMTQWASDTYMYSAVNLFGTYITRAAPSASGETVKVYYPDTQAVATMGIGSNPTFSVGGVGTVEAAVKITQPVSKLASEVSSTAPGADLILVGGPCANALTATVMAADNVTCGNWPYTTGIIKEYTGAFTDGSKALVVAGTTAVDTRSLAASLIGGTLSYAV